LTRIAAPDTIEPEDGEEIEGPRLSEEIRGAFGGGNPGAPGLAAAFLLPLVTIGLVLLRCVEIAL